MALTSVFAPAQQNQNQLDADLYAPQAHSSDIENIASTGNLNIGMVIDYDAHHQARIAGQNRIMSDVTEIAPSDPRTVIPIAEEPAPTRIPTTASPEYSESSYYNVTNNTSKTPPAAPQSSAAPEPAPTDTSQVSAVDGGGSVSGRGGNYSVNTGGGDINDSFNTTVTSTTITHNYYGTVNNYYFGDGHGGGDVINILLTTITNNVEIVNVLTQDLLINVTNTVDNVTNHSFELLGDIVVNITNTFNPIIINLQETLDCVLCLPGDGGGLGGLLGAYDPLIDLDIIGLAGLSQQNGNDSNLLDLDLLALAHGGTSANQDNDLLDLDILGFAQGNHTATQDNDFLDLDVGLLASGTSTAGSDHDFIDIDVGLLTPQDDGLLSADVDHSALSETLPLAGSLAENLLGEVPIISLDIPHPLQDEAAPPDLLAAVTDLLPDDAAGDFALFDASEVLTNVVDGGNLFSGGAADAPLDASAFLQEPPPVVSHVMQGLFHHG